MHIPAPRLPFRLPMTNLPAALKTKTPTPTLGSILCFPGGCLGEKKLYEVGFCAYREVGRLSLGSSRG